jgi:hypothetical protein
VRLLGTPGELAETNWSKINIFDRRSWSYIVNFMHHSDSAVHFYVTLKMCVLSEIFRGFELFL